MVGGETEGGAPMDTAFVITWTTPFAGREEQALGLGAEADEYWGAQAKDGRCTEPEWFFFGNGVGMWMVKGDRHVLEELADSDTARRLLAKGSLLLQNWQASFAHTGAGAERYLGEYASAAKDLGIL